MHNKLIVSPLRKTPSAKGETGVVGGVSKRTALENGKTKPHLRQRRERQAWLVG